MKWFKHISDSLDDPFIFDLMSVFGSDGYLVFFGVLEIYSREFKPKDKWKLTVSQPYLTQKLHKRQSTLVIKILKHIKNSGKWEVEFVDNQVVVFIPKFKELIDEWTKRKLGRDSVVTPKKPEPNKKKEVDKEKAIKVSYSDSFLEFYNAYPIKKEKPAAYKAWIKNKPDLQTCLLAIKNQKDEKRLLRENPKLFCPEWKNPATWLNKGCWEDTVEIKTESTPHQKPLTMADVQNGKLEQNG